MPSNVQSFRQVTALLTSNDYYAASPDQRAQMLANAAQEARDMNATDNRPPIAHTHRGKPVEFALQGHHESTKTGRAPTHRKPGPAVVPAKFAHLAILREHTNG